MRELTIEQAELARQQIDHAHAIYRLWKPGGIALLTESGARVELTADAAQQVWDAMLQVATKACHDAINRRERRE